MQRIVVFCGLLLWSAGAAAQDRPPQAPARSPDFFLAPPRGWISVGGGLIVPRAGGELFRFVSDQLTVDRSDLRTPVFDLEAGIALAPNFALVTGFETGRQQVPSEYRHFVSAIAQPIEQTTKLEQLNVTVGLRYAPLGMGRRISRYAFIPRRIVPSIAAGVNLAHYQLTQSGQFVDYVDLSIFTDSFQSNGWAAGPYVRAGADVQVWRHVFLAVSGKYSWAHAGLDNDFVGFPGIDLAGFTGHTGFSVVF